MNRNYIFLTILMLVLAAGTWLLNKPSELKQIKPNDLLWEIIQPTRYITTDQVAKMIIEKDPSLMVIDVRNSDEYNEYIGHFTKRPRAKSNSYNLFSGTSNFKSIKYIVTS